MRSIVVAIALALAFTAPAAIPAPEKLLPADTLLVVTVPDLLKAGQTWRQLPQAQLWADPALRPFKESFLRKWDENLVKPLEREQNIKLSDYTSLLQGQLTFAITRNGWDGDGDPPLGWLLLLDSKDKSSQLKTNLSDLRKRWTESGKAVRTEKVRGVEFAVLSLSSNDVPKTLRKFLPRSSEVQEIGDDSQPKFPPPNRELFLGQVESLLIVGNSLRPVEKIVARLTGGTLPALADVSAYQANQAAFYRDPAAYAWINVNEFVETWLRKAEEKKDNPAAPNPFDLKPEKIVRALGLAGLKTAAASFRAASDGEHLDVFLSVPESGRQGAFKILAGEAKDLNPPPFAPADVIKFQRWRIDGQKAWATIEKMLADISPQWLGGVQFLLQTANAAGKEKDPGFDVRQNLIGNLGDDIIVYAKAPRDGNPGASGPALSLIASPKPEQLASALKSVLVFFGQQPGATLEPREFLGRKIYTASLGNLALPLSGAATPAGPKALHYAASGGYVALSSDAALLEEYLRACDTQGKSLRDTIGLVEAMQQVTGPGASWFGYENETESMRATLEALRKLVANTNTSPNQAAAVVPGALGLGEAPAGIQDWLDFSLLPPFERIAKYFSFRVYGGSANAEGLMFKMFVATPRGLRGGEAK